MNKLVSGSLLSLSLWLAACSSSSSSGSPGTGDGSGDTGDTAKDATAVCSVVKQADVQTLLSHPITGTEFTGSTTYNCAWDFVGADGSADNDIHLTFYMADDDKSSYENLNDGTVQTTPLSGVGDEAYWFQAVAGGATPTVVAHKGSATCVIDAPADPADTTITYTPPLNVSSGDAATFAVKMGVICTEIFAN